MFNNTTYAGGSVHFQVFVEQNHFLNDFVYIKI